MENQEQYSKSSYLTFSLNQEHFAIPVNQILEIIEIPMVTVVPNASRYIRGVLNFRGEIVPVIDMHERFNMKSGNNEAGMVIIINSIINARHMHLGLLVSDVFNVTEIEIKNIRNIPDSGIHYNPEFLTGMVDINNQFMMLINIHKVLDPLELAESAQVI